MNEEQANIFFSSWFNHPMKTQGRKDLSYTDKVWEQIYKNCIDNDYKEEIFSGKLLFRVLTGGTKKPIYEEYFDQNNQDEVFKKEYEFWEKQNDITAIDFDNHWVSFTDSVDVINSSYFKTKHLRGFVIVINPKKAINAHFIWPRGGFDEREVVAPMDKSTVVEILPFDEFIKKYIK